LYMFIYVYIYIYMYVYIYIYICVCVCVCVCVHYIYIIYCYISIIKIKLYVILPIYYIICIHSYDSIYADRYRYYRYWYILVLGNKLRLRAPPRPTLHPAPGLTNVRTWSHFLNQSTLGWAPTANAPYLKKIFENPTRHFLMVGFLNGRQ